MTESVKHWFFSKSKFIIGGSVALSFFLVWLVWRKAYPGFPVVFRGSDLGKNLLGARNTIWEIPFLGLFFILINHWLSHSLFRERKSLQKLILSVNIGIALLVLIISIQLYWLNL